MKAAIPRRAVSTSPPNTSPLSSAASGSRRSATTAYFHEPAAWSLLESDADGFTFEVKIGDGPPIRLGKEQVSFHRLRVFHVAADRVFKIDARDAKSLESLTPAEVEGKAVFAEVSGVGSRDRAASRAITAFMTRMTALKASVVVNVCRQLSAATGFARGRAIDPENPRTVIAASAERPGPPLITVHDPKLLALFESLPLGASDKAVVSVHLGEPVTRPVKVRNVVGLLRDWRQPKDSYVIVTAHYDHIGKHGAAGAKNDQIYNGANDDGSGTVSVVELASALATLKTHPKRSILFMTFFGEEKGLLGSRYYGRHPVVPIEKTVAGVNLEQLGRTDDVEGPRIGAAVMTGHGYSDVSDVFTAAGQSEEIRVYPTSAI